MLPHRARLRGASVLTGGVMPRLCCTAVVAWYQCRTGDVMLCRCATGFYYVALPCNAGVLRGFVVARSYCAVVPCYHVILWRCGMEFCYVARPYYAGAGSVMLVLRTVPVCYEVLLLLSGCTMSVQ